MVVALFWLSPGCYLETSNGVHVCFLSFSLFPPSYFIDLAFLFVSSDLLVSLGEIFPQLLSGFFLLQYKSQQKFLGLPAVNLLIC